MSPLRTTRLLLAVWLGVLSHLLVAADIAVARTTDGGQQLVRESVSLLSLVGDPASLGRQAGELLAPQTRIMMAEMLRAGDPDNDVPPISQEYLDEINAWAVAAKCDAKNLLRANLTVDVFCTAVVRLPDTEKNRPLLIARNMDFAHAQLLGSKTVLIARRPTGRHASLSIGWPGYAGIVSGMNDAGVSACLLLNHAAKRNKIGDSLGFRLRAILDHSATLDEAVTRYAAEPTTSANYVLLADATSAAVVWWSGGEMHRMTPNDGWLFCTNARFDPNSHLPDDARARHAHELTRVRPNPDVEWMKHLLSATYLRGINAQAMVLVPATRTVHLAVFNGTAAALSPWHALDGARLMAGDDLATVPLVSSPALSDPFPHYTALKQ